MAHIAAWAAVPSGTWPCPEIRLCHFACASGCVRQAVINRRGIEGEAVINRRGIEGEAVPHQQAPPAAPPPRDTTPSPTAAAAAGAEASHVPPPSSVAPTLPVVPLPANAAIRTDTAATL